MKRQNYPFVFEWKEKWFRRICDCCSRKHGECRRSWLGDKEGCSLPFSFVYFICAFFSLVWKFV